ncbi:hypothetical protein NQ314_013444 [Rhamnusium bicolor]|uniref:ZAD domain-containing protein n=1 Tax=Rhamnusium bicolor TaxID=1586634 RepID=A0AAV8X7H5_9CUCU|nr:hypothetical protein NQ314_013444 [Rhamnusium bicolor]
MDIESDDILPRNVCITCINQLEDIHSFINLSKNNDEILKEIVRKIKLEPYKEKFDSESDTADDPPEVSNEFEDDYDNVKIKSCENKLATVYNPKDAICLETNERKKVNKKRGRHSTKKTTLKV